MSPRGLKARGKLADAVPSLSADQAETVLSRLREHDYGGPDDPLVKSLLERLGETAGVRRRNRAAKWFDAKASGVEQRRANRAAHGTVAQQRDDYKAYVNDLARRMEDGTRGSEVTARMKEYQAQGRGMKMDKILTSTPDTMRKHLSPEALQWLAQENGGPPLSFDAWRYSHLGARDADAVASHQRRSFGFFSEYG